ncbi:DUF397 domain-containing protein [Streptomyces triculaminicus]|uniref:DUF397 domain-containing protein n=1 Tax=Streptomyces triculaminicus TaxID=2816232 RepID=UPI00378E437B
MPAPHSLTIAHWRSSSYSEGGGQCLQVPVEKVSDLVPVRDSKYPDRTPLVFSDAAWQSFVTAVAVPDGPLSP